MLKKIFKKLRKVNIKGIIIFTKRKENVTVCVY